MLELLGRGRVWDTREVHLEELLVFGAIGWRVQHAIDIVEDILRRSRFVNGGIDLRPNGGV